ncbi:hypothetical protein FA13DRAFT_1691588 [Coprinellus micaceus]|uniref:Thioesterase/thiol ester dehydrase-isomerase n=1 Tax=Coprinellus micaceus TaxID=71717 RepID=A0A4Y7SZU6_COPMI|nr:hypothetical protein FA13DRAFT_1691588 [Coprinellus micaceus]
MSDYIALASALAYFPSPTLTSLFDMSSNSPIRPANRRPTAIAANLAHTIVRSVLRSGPKQFTLNILKALCVVIIALNLKSFPFIFHLRLSRPVLRCTLRDWFHALRVKLSRRDVGRHLEDRWLDTVPLVGTSPFEYRDTFRTRATLDECDYNIHLSNSSYAKVLDIARFESVVRLFPLLFRSGAGMALGASHFHFIKEIPALQEFEIRTSIGSWDHKWLYMVSKFVSRPPRSNRPDSSTLSLPSPPLTSASSRSLSPASSASSSPSFFYESDGSLVYTVVVAQVCFKANRITIPPSVVLASNGFCSPPDSIAGAGSRSKPSSPELPPHWPKVKTIASPAHGGSLKHLYEFYRGGWRSMPVDERWWENALGGYVEIHRATASLELARLREGLESARSL